VLKIAISKRLCVLTLVHAALGIPVQEQTGNDFIILHVRVFDGKSVVNNTSVLISQGKVAAIGCKLKRPKSRQGSRGQGLHATTGFD
jgi:hypothetical protein